jgi:hypothetical protein
MKNEALSKTIKVFFRSIFLPQLNVGKAQGSKSPGYQKKDGKPVNGLEKVAEIIR